MSETLSKLRIWVPSERTSYPEAPFDLKDNDGPSHLWVIAYILEDRHGLKATADNIRERAIQWAKERALSRHDRSGE